MSDVLVFPTSRTGRYPGEASPCPHEIFTWDELVLSVCPVDGSAEWLAEDETIDGSVAMARLFGAFDLVAAVDAIGAPGATTLVYEPGRRGSKRLQAFPPHRWLEGAPGLYFAHDGNHLLLSPVDPRFAENVIR